MADDPRLGTQIGGYRLISLLGRGGMGVVYLAEQIALGRPVAFKLLAPEYAESPQFRARFQRESRLAASIDHPNVTPIYEAGEVEGLLFLAMRYVRGTDLRALLEREGKLSLERATTVAARLAAALDAAHAAGLAHRDVKPGNVLIADPGESEHVYLTDFGLTKHISSESGLTRTGQWMGTLDYVAPEQIEGKPVDARADIYALACVLFEAVTGRLPFAHEADMAKMYAHVHESPPSARAHEPTIPLELDAVIARGLAKDPDERQPSAGDLARAASAAVRGTAPPTHEGSVAAGSAAPAIASAPQKTAAPSAAALGPTRIEEEPPPAYTHGSAPADPPPKRRGPAVAIIAAAAFLAVGGAAAALVFGGTRQSAGPTTTVEQADTPSREGRRPATSRRPRPPKAGTGLSLVDYETTAYTARRPADWDVVQDYEAQGDGRHVSKFASPDGSSSVIVDTTANAQGDPKDSAETLDAQKSGSPGYRRLKFARTTLGGDPAFEWDYAEGGEYKVDLFFFRGDDGFAVLGEGPRSALGDLRNVARQVGDSVEPVGGSASDTACGDLVESGAGSYNVVAKNESCSVARQVAEEWEQTCASSGDAEEPCFVPSNYKCDYEQTGYESGEVTCSSEGSTVRFENGA